MRQGSISQTTIGFGDLYPEAIIRWSSGVNNWMVYGAGDIPVGNYSSTNLANIGIGHGAADGDAGYTYFDPKGGARILRGHRADLQFSEPKHRLSERHRLAC